MTDLLLTIVAFIVSISVLVAVHEYGHYLVGRLCGMKVLRFSIGFGKPLWTRRAGKDQTEYCISSLPLGGYVKFLDEREGAVAPADQGRAFNHRPVPQRIAVLLAGPAFNFLFAVLAYWALFVNGVPTVRPIVGDVAPDSYAAAAGLERGDRIIEVSGREAADWEAVLVTLLDRLVTEGRVEMKLEAEDGWERTATLAVGDDRASLTEPGKLFERLGFEPGLQTAVLGEVSPDSAAERAGLEPGDRITAIGDAEIRDFGELVEAIGAYAPGDRVLVEFRRRGEARQREVVLGGDPDSGRALLGVRAQDPRYLRQYPLVPALGEAAGQTWASTVFTVNMLGRMITGDVSIKNISGPINIAQYAGDSVERGLDYYLRFLALVSISLGVLNLLPIPVLDGGQIVFQLAEGIKGSPLSDRTQLAAQQVGILALLLLMSFAIYNDIARLVG